MNSKDAQQLAASKGCKILMVGKTFYLIDNKGNHVTQDGEREEFSTLQEVVERLKMLR